MAINIKPANKGLLHKELGVPAAAPIPAKKLAKAVASPNPAEKKRAVFAENAKKWNHPAKAAALPKPSMQHAPGKVKPVKTDRGEFGFRGHK
jgi:hypothetical protein